MQVRQFALLVLCIVPAVLMAQKPPKNPPAEPFRPAIAYVQIVNNGARDLMLMNAEGHQCTRAVPRGIDLAARPADLREDGRKGFRSGGSRLDPGTVMMICGQNED